MRKFLIFVLIGFIGVAMAHQVVNQNINTRDKVGEQWAWGDVFGWLDWHDAGIHNVEVSGLELRGWASSTIGQVAVNCATTPNGDICSSYSEPFKVNQDPPSTGDLAGWGWNENVGWVSFCGNASGGSMWNGSRWVCPATPTYQVKIKKDGVNPWSFFEGWAWNDVVGWASFNCANSGTSGCSGAGFYYKVQTSAGGESKAAAIESSVFDTGSLETVFNSITWQGSLNSGTVQFELATSNNSGGPWNYSIVTPTLVAGQPRKLSGNQYVNRRYIRYRITLNSDVWQSATPKIDDVIINWSP